MPIPLKKELTESSTQREVYQRYEGAESFLVEIPQGRKDRTGVEI